MSESANMNLVGGGFRETMTRRGVIRLLTGGAAFAYLALTWRDGLAEILVPEGEDRFFSRLDTTTNTRVIEGLDFELKPSYLSATSNLIVRGYQVAVRTALSLPGRSVTIFAHELLCEPGAAISTAGPPGRPSYTIRKAPPAVGLGSNGHDGAIRGAVQGVGLDPNVGDGGHGGDITIVTALLTGRIALDASGGSGGDAESGSDGAPGKPGDDATPLHAGIQGQSGGIGGKAGYPGIGGDGGKIWVGALMSFPADQVRALSKEGAAGAPGQNGHSGKGGHSGNPGSGTYWHEGMCEGLPPERTPR